MICNATSIKKYLDKSPKMFLIYGSEIVLINDSADQINDFFLKKDFSAFKKKKCLFAMTAHVIYKDIDNINTVTHSRKIIDTRGIFKINQNNKVVYL